MEISKFPVTGKYYEYKVKISKPTYTDDYIVDLILESKYLKFFKKEKIASRKQLSTYTWSRNFIEMAKHIVWDYEQWLEKEWENDKLEQKGIDEWNKWDGKIFTNSID